MATFHSSGPLASYDQAKAEGQSASSWAQRPGVVVVDDDQRLAAADAIVAHHAEMIVESSVRDPAGRSETAGAAWGRALVERARPLARLPRAEAMRRLQELLDELGFEPEVPAGGRRILLHRCPFREVAGEHQAVVCSAHLGLIKGALGELGVDAGAATIEPLVTPTLCVTHLPARRR